MSIILTDTLRPLPVTTSSGPMLTIAFTGGRGTLSVNKAAVLALGLQPDTAVDVVLMASRTEIGIEVPTGRQATRRLSSKGTISIKELREAFHLREGEAFKMPAQIENGRLVASLPDTIITRINMAARKIRVAGGQAA